MKEKIIFSLTVFLSALALTQTAFAAPITYGNGFYTNLCGSNDASFYSCEAWCDPNNGFCSTIDKSSGVSKYWVYRWTCDGQQIGCGERPGLLTPSDSLKYLEVSRNRAGAPTGCDKTVQLDVFDKFCGSFDESGWFPEWNCGGLPDPHLKGYMVWYSGQCNVPPPTPRACTPTVSAHGPSPVNGASGVSLNPNFSWSWDCGTDWVKWADVFIWDCNPNGDRGCSAGKPLSFAHLGPGATSATLSQFINLPSLYASTKYYWEVVPNSDPTTNNIWNFTTMGCPASDTTNAYVGLSSAGPWASKIDNVGENNPVYVKATNQGGLSPMTVSISPGGSSSVPNDNPFPVTNPASLTPEKHTVTAYKGETNNFCGSPASYTCQATDPVLAPTSPINSIATAVSALPVRWQISSFGMNQCGGNIIDSRDQIKATLYSRYVATQGKCDDSDPTLTVGSCSLSGADALGPTSHKDTCNITVPNTSLWVPDGRKYCWRLEATNNNWSTKFSKDTSFTYNPNAAAWFQTVNGGVFAGRSLQSTIPSTCISPTNCFFNINPDAADYPGIAAYHSGNSNFATDPSTLSVKKWLAQTAYNIRPPSYADFIRQIPVTPDPITNGGHLTGKVNSGGVTGGSDALYLIYDNGAATDSTDLTISNLNVNNNKVILYVPPSTSGHVVNITGNIKVNQGIGFFGLITGRSVIVGEDVTEVDGLIFTDAGGNAFTTVSNGSPDDPSLKQLVIDGTVVVTSGNTSLNRTLSKNAALGGPLNNTLEPAEKFSFEPAMIFTMPRGLRRLQYQVNEVPTTGE